MCAPKAFTSYLSLYNSSRKVDANCSHEWNSVGPFGGELTHLGIFRAWKQTHNYWFPNGIRISSPNGDELMPAFQIVLGLKLCSLNLFAHQKVSEY